MGALLAFAVVVDALGRLLIDPTFHVDTVLLGSLIGALLLVTATAAVNSVRLPGGWELRKPPPKIKDVDTDDKGTP